MYFSVATSRATYDRLYQALQPVGLADLADVALTSVLARNDVIPPQRAPGQLSGRARAANRLT
jgi:hypothetical protein